MWTALRARKRNIDGYVIIESKLWCDVKSLGLQESKRLYMKSFYLQRKVLMWTASRAPKRNIDVYIIVKSGFKPWCGVSN